MLDLKELKKREKKLFSKKTNSYKKQVRKISRRYFR